MKCLFPNKISFSNDVNYQSANVRLAEISVISQYKYINI